MMATHRLHERFCEFSTNVGRCSSIRFISGCKPTGHRYPFSLSARSKSIKEEVLLLPEFYTSSQKLNLNQVDVIRVEMTFSGPKLKVCLDPALLTFLLCSHLVS